MARNNLGRIVPGHIVEAAMELTRERGLDGWSVRDIQRRLGASPSSIYHHVGGREELARLVVGRVLSDLDLPPEDTEWKSWFRLVLLPIADRLGAHPGVAQWMLLHGPVFPQLMPVLDTAIGKLRDAGFGDDAALAFSVIFNTLTSAVAIDGERRRRATEPPPPDAAGAVERMRALAATSTGGQAIARLMSEFAEGDAAAATRRYHEYLIQVVLDGLEQDALRKSQA